MAGYSDQIVNVEILLDHYFLINFYLIRFEYQFHPIINHFNCLDLNFLINQPKKYPIIDYLQ